MLKTIEWCKDRVKLIDQTKLPHRLVYVICKDVSSVWKAIKNMKVRGAPAIGIAGALGVVLSIYNDKTKNLQGAIKKINEAIDYLNTARPTAVNLAWALERMRKTVHSPQSTVHSLSHLKKTLLKEAMEIINEDKRVCRLLGMHGAKLIKGGDRILTHCNAGALATYDYGTALACLYTAKKQGRKFFVYVDETRPLLQGSRLTAWELKNNKIDFCLICDDMGADLMRKRKIDKIFVGADRIAANGDTANKIGTYSLAALAKFHNIPFYVVSPLSTFDLSIKDGGQIPIEQRDPEEVTNIGRMRIAPKDIDVYYPAFDVTPGNFISAIVTEKGILRKPCKKSIAKLGSNIGVVPTRLTLGWRRMKWIQR